MNRVKIPKTWDLTFPPQNSNHPKHFPKIHLIKHLKKTLVRFPKTLISLKPITLPIFREYRPVIKPFYHKILKKYKQDMLRYLNIDLGHISFMQKHPLRTLKTLRLSSTIKSQQISHKTQRLLHKIISSNKHLKRIHLPPDFHFSKICFQALSNLKTLSHIFIPIIPFQNGLFQRVLTSNSNLKKVHFNNLMTSERDSFDPQTSIKILETLTSSSRLQKLQFYLNSPSTPTLQDLPLQKLNQKNIHYDICLFLTPQDILRSNPNLLNLDLFGLYVESEEYYCEWKKYLNLQFSLRKNAYRKLYLIDLPQSLQNNPNPLEILRSCLNIHTLHLTLPHLPQTTDYTPIRQLANLAHLSLDLATEALEPLIEHFTYNFNTFRKIESIILKSSITSDIILLPLWTACANSLKKLTLIFQHKNPLNTNLNGFYNGLGFLQNLEAFSICLSDCPKEHKEPLRRVFDEHYSAINAFMNEGIPLKEFTFCAFPNSALSVSTLKFNLNYNFSTLEKISLDIRNRKVDPREEILLNQAINLKYLHLYLYEWNASRVREFLKKND